MELRFLSYYNIPKYSIPGYIPYWAARAWQCWVSSSTAAWPNRFVGPSHPRSRSGGLVESPEPWEHPIVVTTVWYGMVWYGMVWYGMVWYGMVWYGMVWYGMVWYGMVWYGMVWYGMVWYGMVWYGMVWYGMVWYGMVWYGMVWYDIV